MDEYADEARAETSEAVEPLEKADPPRPVRGLRWVFGPTLAGAAVGAAWSSYYAAAQRLDPATPIWVGGAIGLGIGASLWAFFPYKGRPRRRPNPPNETLHE